MEPGQYRYKMNNVIKSGKGALLVFLILLSVYHVNAFAISSKYYEDNPLFVAPGDTKEVELTLQNLAGTEDVKVKAEVSRGTEVIELIDASDIYTIPVGGKITARFKVEMPKNAKVKDTYSIDIRFTTVTEGELGALGLGSSIIQRFDVIAGENSSIFEEKPIPLYEYVAIGIAAVLILIILVILAKKKKKRKISKKSK